jgi:hypothetical protein
MSSSYRLKKRMETPQYDMSYMNATPFNHYIAVNKECSPQFKAYPIGSPWGVKVCVLKDDYGVQGCNKGAVSDFKVIDKKLQSQQPAQKLINRDDPSRTCPSISRKVVDLYDPTAKEPYSLNNPYPYAVRARVPNDDVLIPNNTLVKPIYFDGIGFSDKYSPDQTTDYAYDMVPNAPARYDVTQLIDKYALWKQYANRREANGVGSIDSNYILPYSQ